MCTVKTVWPRQEASSDKRTSQHIVSHCFIHLPHSRHTFISTHYSTQYNAQQKKVAPEGGRKRVCCIIQSDLSIDLDYAVRRVVFFLLFLIIASLPSSAVYRLLFYFFGGLAQAQISIKSITHEQIHQQTMTCHYGYVSTMRVRMCFFVCVCGFVGVLLCACVCVEVYG